MEKLDVINKFKDSNTSKNCRDELINVSFEDEEKYNFVFNLSFDKLKEYVSNLGALDKFSFISFCIRNNKFDDSILFGLCELLDDSYKFEIIKLFGNCFSSYHYNKIITSINDENVKISLIYYLFSISSSVHLISGIISNLSFDENKELFLNKIPINARVKILKTFNDKQLIKKYVFEEEYSNYRSSLIVFTEDYYFIKEQFIASDSSIFRKNILSKINDNDFKYELIKCCNDSDVCYFYGSNIERYTDKYLVDVNEGNIKDSCINDDITIGVELELYNKNINYYKGIDSVFGNYKIVKDSTLKHGIEIVSPVMGFNKEDLQRLKSLCKVIKNCGFYTDKTCGGHIHIGADYLSKKEDFFMLLYLYSNCEDIIYSITDKENTNKRKDVSRYSKKVKDVFVKGVCSGVINNEQDFDSFIDNLRCLAKSRYVGLNFSNLGKDDKNTIEFRMPNGEIDFDEIVANIKLCAKLVQKSHDLNNSGYMDKEIELLGCNISDKRKLDILLDILFDKEEEKKIYKRRYKANSKIINSIQRKMWGFGGGIKMDVKERKLIRG